MRTRTLIVICAIGLALSSLDFLTAQIVVRQQAPTDRAADFPLAEIEATIREMDADDRSTVRLVEGGSYNVNIRRLRGAETALMHPRTTDVYVVRDGSGTLVTGGQIVDATGQPVDGQRGAAIRGGTERVISAGDLVFIPAGVPHGIRDSSGITWFNIRFDTR
jgi:mannose-6-phosphate isomerase-like protein (cupin superfamily)